MIEASKLALVNSMITMCKLSRDFFLDYETSTMKVFVNLRLTFCYVELGMNL